MAAVLGVIGGVVNAVGAIQQGKAQAAQATYQAQVARNNAIIAKQNAAYEIEAGKVEEQTQRLKTNLTIGETKAIQGASGLEVGVGSAEDVVASTATIGELDALTIRANAARRTYSYETESTNYTAQGSLYDMEAVAAKKAAAIGAFGSILGGISSVAGKWQGWQSGGSSSSSRGGGFFTPFRPTPLINYTIPGRIRTDAAGRVLGGV